MKKLLFCFIIFSVFTCSCCTYGSGPEISNSSSLDSSIADSSTENSQSSSSLNSAESSITDLPNVSDVDLQLYSENGVLFWKDVDALVYGIYIEGSLIGTSAVNRFSADLSIGIYVAEVRAYFSIDPSVYASAFTDLIIAAAAPAVSIENNFMQWNNTEGAIYYEIYKNGVYHAKTDDLFFTLTDFGSYRVRAIFADERFNSPFSKEITFGVTELISPEIHLESGILKWTGVMGAEYYTVLFNGENAIIVTHSPELSVDVGILYSIKFASKYPDGVIITVTAHASNLKDSLPSNEVFYRK